MGRTRTFDEAEAVHSAARLFARLGYEGTSVDDLVLELKVHRGSLYRTFGSKLNLFHIALRTHIDADVLPWTRRLGNGTEQFVAAVTDPGVDLRLLLIAMVERAPVDPVAAAEVARAWRALEAAVGTASDQSAAVAAGSLGLRLAAPACLNGAQVTGAARTLATLLAPQRSSEDQPS